MTKKKTQNKKLGKFLALGIGIIMLALTPAIVAIATEIGSQCVQRITNECAGGNDSVITFAGFNYGAAWLWLSGFVILIGLAIALSKKS